MRQARENPILRKPTRTASRNDHAQADAGRPTPRATNGKPVKAAKADPPPPPPPPKAGVIPIHFDNLSSKYLTRNRQGEFQPWPNEILKSMLRKVGFSDSHRHPSGLTYLEEEMFRITDEQSVHYAGPLGGYKPGLYEIHGCRVLVTRGPKPIEPKEGDWPTLRTFLSALLGEEWKYFCAWLKVALQSLRDGVPWSPGQMLSIAGPPGSGKSVLQSLVTPLLGGRVSSPYSYMSSGTNFNSEIYGAEHGLIGDVNHAIDNRARRNFGSAIKKLVVEPVHYIHAKGKTPISLTPFIRLTLSLNDNADALMVLPSFDSDVVDKIILLKANAVDFPRLMKKFLTFQEFYCRLVSELPAFVYHLRRWRIPESIADTRYGVVSYHNADLVEKVKELSDEAKLLDVIDTHIFCDETKTEWCGTASELEKKLSREMRPGETSRLFRYSSHCGQLLALLAKEKEGRVTAEKKGKNKKAYLIRRATDDSL